jgi:predicted RNA-binding protein (virulence factor B family)
MMVEIGRINKLTVISAQGNEVQFDGGALGSILLAEKYASGKYRAGDEVEVFVYIDREDQLLAITSKPYATVGQFVRLRVAATTSSGAFLAWGMKNDLLVPKSEQLSPMAEGESYVVYVFLSEKTNRITASSKLDKFLGLHPPEYVEGEEVDLIIFDKTDLGYRAVINQVHVGMIYENEVFQKLSIGQQLKGYIYNIREDFKIDLRLQQSGYDKVDDISQSILNILKENGGESSLSDKSPPDEIYAQFGVSKKVFKKAIGALYKKRLITISRRSGISLVDQ